MAVWLIAKGFTPTAIAAESAGETSRLADRQSEHCLGGVGRRPSGSGRLVRARGST